MSIDVLLPGIAPATGGWGDRDVGLPERPPGQVVVVTRFPSSAEVLATWGGREWAGGRRLRGVDQVELGVRVAEAGDVDAVVATLTSAFFDDPMWGPVFPEVERRSEQASALWRFFVTSSLKFRWTFVTADAGATAVWIPPGEVELTPAEEADLERLLVDVTGREVAADVMATLALFEDAHPAEPHCYLSLLGTDGTHRGRGIGMALLRDNLARIDALGLPAYLESSNPANDKRYESVGFRPHATIVAASGHAMTTMWRPARTG